MITRPRLGTCTQNYETREFQMVRSRLYQRRFGPPNNHFATFFEIYKIYTPPLGAKKTTEFVSPQKESFGKSELVWVDFVFKVGVKICWADFVFKVGVKIDL